VLIPLRLALVLLNRTATGTLIVLSDLLLNRSIVLLLLAQLVNFLRRNTRGRRHSGNRGGVLCLLSLSLTGHRLIRLRRLQLGILSRLLLGVLNVVLLIHGISSLVVYLVKQKSYSGGEFEPI
jgi:hypothetical protein